MTLEEHILNCLPYLVEEQAVLTGANTEIFSYGENNFYYYKFKDQWILYIHPQFRDILKNSFNINGEYVHNIISKYLGITAISHFPEIRQVQNRYNTLWVGN